MKSFFKSFNYSGLMISLTFIVLSACEKDSGVHPDENQILWKTQKEEKELLIDKLDKLLTKYEIASYEVIRGKESGAILNIEFFDKNKNLISTHLSGEVIRDVSGLIRKIETINKTILSLPSTKGVYTVVEKQPKPEDGMQAFYAYIQNNMRYPEQAKKAGAQGKVFVQFIVNEFGEVTETTVLKGIGYGCDEVAARIVQNGPKWEPGYQNGEAVKVRMVLPISFKLDP